MEPTDPEAPGRTPLFANLFRARFDDENGPDRRNRGVALSLSLLAAFLLWFTFSMREEYTVPVDLPTTVVDVPEDQALSAPPPRRVRVTASGQGWQLLNHLLRDPRPVPISAQQEGELDLQASGAFARLPTGIRVEDVVPARVELSLEPRVTRRVPVRLRADISPAPPYDLLRAPSVSPDSVTLSGPASMMSGVRVWPTERVTLNDLRDGIEVPLNLSDTLSGVIGKSEQTVTLLAEIEAFTEGERVIPVRVTGTPAGYEAQTVPSLIRVVYRVPLSQYDSAAESEAFYATVPYSELAVTDLDQVVPTLHLPPDLSLYDVRFTPRRLGYIIRLNG